MSNRTLNMTDPVYDYLRAVSPPESPLLRRLREETAPLELARMQIAPEQGQLMGLLARLVNARQAIEVGVFTGYSSLCVAQALPADGRARCFLNRAGVSSSSVGSSFANPSIAGPTSTSESLSNEENMAFSEP